MPFHNYRETHALTGHLRSETDPNSTFEFNVNYRVWIMEHYLTENYFTEGNVVPIHATKRNKGVEVYFHSFLTSALDGRGAVSFSSGPLHPRETDHSPPPRTATHWTTLVEPHSRSFPGMRDTFFSPKLHGWVWGPISPLLNEYHRLLLRCQTAHGMKLTTYFHTATRLWISGAIPPLLPGYE
jgi:hypothetical protein